MPLSIVEQELRHVRDLVVVREALRVRGATALELSECDTVIAAARAQLAAVTQCELRAA